MTITRYVLYMSECKFIAGIRMASTRRSFPTSILHRSEPYRSPTTEISYKSPLPYLANEGQFLDPRRIGHIDGWCVGDITNGVAKIVDRSGQSAFEQMERVDAAMAQCVESDFFIGHVRRGSIDPVTHELRGGRTELNTQPFHRGNIIGAHC